MWRARRRQLLEELMWSRLLGRRPLVGVLMWLTLGEILKSATGLIRRNDAGEVKLRDATVSGSYDFT